MSDNPQENKGKVALVTGSSSGIGEQVAYEYAKLGYNVTLTGRNEKRLNEVAAKCKELSPFHAEALPVIADFVDLKQVDEALNKTIRQFNRLDIVVNNAGYAGERKMFDEPGFMEDYENIMTVNLTAVVRMCYLALPYLKQTKGVIINVSSLASRIPLPTVSYSISKAGCSMLTKTLANVVGTSGVRVNTVSPGPIVTNFSPDQAKHGVLSLLGRSGEVREVANLIVFLSSDKAPFIQGAEYDIDGGMGVKCPGVDIMFPQKKA